MTKTIPKPKDEDGYENPAGEFEKSPDMLALDTLTRKLLLIPKGELEKAGKRKHATN